jgi:hypothetical protein
MAIEVRRKTKIKAPLWALVLGALCLLLLLGLLVSYFYLAGALKETSREIQEKEKLLLATSSQKKLAERLALTQNRINNFADLASKHQKVSNILDFIESSSLPEVNFTDFAFNSKQQIAILSGQAASFVALEQQLQTFKEEPLIKNINLSDLAIDKEKGVIFTISFVVEPALLK